MELTARLNAGRAIAETFLVSAVTGDGLLPMKQRLAALMPASPFLFPPDDVSDMPNRLLASEVTREKLFLALRQELPYACAVETESWEEKRDGSVRIGQVIYVTRESHRPIVLGEGGRQIKTIGASAAQGADQAAGPHGASFPSCQGQRTLAGGPRALCRVGTRLQRLIPFSWRGMKVFGVACFVIGVAASVALAVRRGNGAPLRWPDYAMMFVGLAGAIIGLAALFSC